MPSRDSNSMANGEISDARRNAADAKREITDVRDDLDRMKLVCAAVWELLKERAKLSEDDLAAKCAEIDARDGVADGRLTRTVRKCSQCGRTLPSKQFKCMYCNAPQPVATVFEGL